MSGTTCHSGNKLHSSCPQLAAGATPGPLLGLTTTLQRAQQQPAQLPSLHCELWVSKIQRCPRNYHSHLLCIRMHPAIFDTRYSKCKPTGNTKNSQQGERGCFMARQAPVLNVCQCPMQTQATTTSGTETNQRRWPPQRESVTRLYMQNWCVEAASNAATNTAECCNAAVLYKNRCHDTWAHCADARCCRLVTSMRHAAASGTPGGPSHDLGTHGPRHCKPPRHTAYWIHPHAPDVRQPRACCCPWTAAAARRPES